MGYRQMTANFFRFEFYENAAHFILEFDMKIGEYFKRNHLIFKPWP